MRAEPLPLAPGEPLPGWCDAWLSAEDAFQGRAFWDATLAHALPPGARPFLLRLGDAAALPLLGHGGAWRSLTTPYSLAWAPLMGPAGADTGEAGRALARALAFRPPLVLEAAGPSLPFSLPAWLAALPYRHFGRWHEELAPGEGWEGYFARRPPELRTTVGRKLARAERDGARFAWLAEPGPALEEGIAAFHAVRAASWKPDEPFPLFDAAFLHALAAEGRARLAVLRRADGEPVAAQYWVLDRAGGARRATVPKLFHDERAKALSPGTVLTAWAIRWLIEEEGARVVDFGRGDDPYKAQWAGAREQRMGLVLASPLHVRGALEIAKALVRRAVGRG
jgi:CelD/BcsL family acetyltransferase involved in cellulose biosynthesis